MGCCCGCPSANVCSNCSDGTPLNLYVSFSGIVLPASGVCFPVSSCLASATSGKLTYTGSVRDTAFCVGSNGTGADLCKWGCSNTTGPFPVAPSGPLAPISDDFYSDGSCVTRVASGAGACGCVVQKTGATTWEIWYMISIGCFFHGTATGDSGCSKVNLDFTNDLTLGQCVTAPCTWGTLFAIATGGSCNLSVQKSCCP